MENKVETDKIRNLPTSNQEQMASALTKALPIGCIKKHISNIISLLP